MGIHLEPVAWHPVDETTVVVEQDATWRGQGETKPGAAPARVATLFRTGAGRVTAALRFDSVQAAFRPSAGWAMIVDMTAGSASGRTQNGYPAGG